MGTELAILGGIGLMGAATKPKNIQAPEARNYLNEMRDALRGQTAIMPELLASEAQFTPAWQNMQKQTLMGQMGIMRDLYNQSAQYSQELGQTQLRAMEPLYAQAGQAGVRAYDAMVGPQATGLYNLLMQQSTQDLMAGNSLTAEEQGQAQQAARAAYAARGITGGNQAAALEVLNNYNMANARGMQRRAMAGEAYNLATNRASNAYNTYGNPLSSMITQTGPAGLIGLSEGMSGNLGSKLFNVESQMSSDINSANIQNQMSTRLGNLQAQAGHSAGMMSMAGNIFGGLFSNENYTPFAQSKPKPKPKNSSTPVTGG